MENLPPGTCLICSSAPSLSRAAFAIEKLRRKTTIILVSHRPGLARAHRFLGEVALGAGDYLALATRFHTLMLVALAAAALSLSSVMSCQWIWTG